MRGSGETEKRESETWAHYYERKGREEGREEERSAWVEKTVLAAFEARGVSLDDDVRARLCARLVAGRSDEFVRRAVAGATADELLAFADE